jgi:hypothetical protein
VNPKQSASKVDLPRTVTLSVSAIGAELLEKRLILIVEPFPNLIVPPIGFQDTASSDAITQSKHSANRFYNFHGLSSFLFGGRFLIYLIGKKNSHSLCGINI